MSVKPEHFEEAKQTILKNKYEFIQIQLQEAQRRVQALKQDNSALKDQITHLKARTASKAHQADRPFAPTHRRSSAGEGNKQNKCVNKNYHAQAVTHRPVIKCIAMANKQDRDPAEELRNLEQQLQDEETRKLQYLQKLEKQIDQLKRQWGKLQGAASGFKQEQAHLGLQQNYDHARVTAEHNNFVNKQMPIRKISQRPKPLLISVETLNQSTIEASSRNNSMGNSLNSSGLLKVEELASQSRQSCQLMHTHQETRRKTMSVNLTHNNLNQLTTGFNFGKKLVSKSRQGQTRPSAIAPQQPSYEKKVSMASLSLANANKASTNTLNNSLSHSNSRNGGSLMSNSSSRRDLIGCSQLRKSQASKSYAKIVTKLQCRGCLGEFRPNEYYRHAQDCIELVKMQLMEEKQRIEEEINQTLNLSAMHY